MNPTPQWSQSANHESVLSPAMQVDRLLDESKRMGDPVLLCATLLSAECGMALPQLVMLTWRHLDLLDGTLAVPSSTSGDVRRVRLSARLQAGLKDWRCGAPSDTAHIFFPTAPRNDAAERIAHSFSRTCERLGLPYSLGALRNALPGARQACTPAAK
jgi:integrase